MSLQQKTGKISFLRASQLGDKFGPPGDSIQAECVVRLTTHSDEAYGFNLRSDSNGVVDSVMVDLLRDAFRDSRTVILDVELGEGNDVKPPDKNGLIRRAALSA